LYFVGTDLGETLCDEVAELSSLGSEDETLQLCASAWGKRTGVGTRLRERGERVSEREREREREREKRREEKRREESEERR
jgi:hypothetical protein